MTVTAKHAFVSGKPDELDTSVVRPSDWNADHSVSLTGPALVGRETANSGVAAEIGLHPSLVFSGGQLKAQESLTILTSTQASSSSTLTDITGLFADLEISATYTVDCFIQFQSSATTTGLNLGFEAPVGSLPFLEIVVPLTTTNASSQLRRIFPSTTNVTSGNVVGTGVTAVNSTHTARISGMVRTGNTAGVLQIRFASEINATTVTLQIGSVLLVRRVA